MMVRRYCDAFLSVILMALVGFISGCTPGEQIAGGSGSTTTNGFTATIVDGHGEPVRNAPVHIRPDNYCAADYGLTAPQVTGTVADTFTGADGTICRGNIEPGFYTIEILDENSGQGVVVRCEITAGPVNRIGGLTVAPLGAIHGGMDVALLNGAASFGVQVYGMERIARIDSTGSFFIYGLPPAEYTVRLVSTDTVFQPVDLDTVVVVSQDTVNINPYAPWGSTAILSINTAAAGLSSNDTVFNFPLLLRLDRNNFDFTTAKKKGEDFRITKNNGTAVPFELEWWDSTNSVAAIWILVDTLCGSVPIQELNLYWGNKRGASVSRPSEVFDTVAGFTGVWHLNQSGGTAQKDATVFNRDGIPLRMDGSNDVAGIIGRSQLFKSDSQCIVFQAVEDFSDTWTVSLWAKASRADSTGHPVFTYGNVYFSLFLDSTPRWFFYEEPAGPEADSCSASALLDTWVHLCGVRRDTNHYLYVNGSIVDSCEITAMVSPDSSNKEIRLGSLNDDAGGFFGSVDELRVYQRTLSDAWVRMCYETQREDQQAITIKKVGRNQ